MNQTDVFLTEMMPKLRQAEVALHNGDAGPRSAMWSHDDAATLFGGVMGGTGWAQIEPIFQRLGASFTKCTSYNNDVIAAEPVATSPTRSPSNTPPPLLTEARPRRTCCASPPCSTASTASGRWSTATPIQRDHRPPATSSSNSRPVQEPAVTDVDRCHAKQGGVPMVGLLPPRPDSVAAFAPPVGAPAVTELDARECPT